MRKQVGWNLGALAAAVLVAACADPTSPTRSLTGDVSTVVNPFVPSNPFPNSLDWGEVRVCKSIPSDDPAQTFSFTATVTPVLPAGPALAPINFSIDAVPGQTICTDIYDSSKRGSQYDQLVISETAVTDWTTTDITVDRYRAIFYTPPAGFTDSEDETSRSATVYVNSDEGRVVTFLNDYVAPPPPPPTGLNGCTPGYWKQEHHFDSWPSAYDPTDSFNATFGIGTNWFADTFTLLDALGANGGGKNALARHAVAALLNSGKGFYPLTTTAVISAVQAAYANGSLIESTKNNFAGKNELGCTLN